MGKLDARPLRTVLFCAGDQPAAAHPVELGDARQMADAAVALAGKTDKIEHRTRRLAGTRFRGEVKGRGVHTAGGKNELIFGDSQTPKMVVSQFPDTQ